MSYMSACKSEYRTWIDMKRRCYNPKRERYQAYGARGICVCDRWRESFDAFYADMGPRPSPDHTLDRKDVNGDYTPENCHWIPRKEQYRNLRRSVYLDYKGERRLLTDIAAETGVSSRRIYQRVIALGWPIERAIVSPVELKYWYEYEGERLPLRKLAVKLGVPYARLYNRVVRLKWPLERAIAESPRPPRPKKSGYRP